MSDPDTGRILLLLDEMHPPAVARALREAGHDVISVAEEASMRAMTDEDLFVWAAERRRRIVTENVRDFRRLLAQYQEAGRPVASLLYTTSDTFPRIRRNPGPLIKALDVWLSRPEAADRSPEDWLQPV